MRITQTRNCTVPAVACDLRDGSATVWLTSALSRHWCSLGTLSWQLVSWDGLGTWPSQSSQWRCTLVGSGVHANVCVTFAVCERSGDLGVAQGQRRYFKPFALRNKMAIPYKTGIWFQINSSFVLQFRYKIRHSWKALTRLSGELAPLWLGGCWACHRMNWVWEQEGEHWPQTDASSEGGRQYQACVGWVKGERPTYLRRAQTILTRHCLYIAICNVLRCNLTMLYISCMLCISRKCVV